MVPPTHRAHLDDVERHVVRCRGKGAEFGLGRDHPTAGWHARPERERDVDEQLVFADRTRRFGRTPEVLRDTEQLGLRVADIQLGEAAPPEVPDRSIPGKAVLDLTHARHGRFIDGSLPVGHEWRVLPSSVNPAIARGAHRRDEKVDISTRCIAYAVSVLEFTILGLLKERPMHGYDLRKRIREEFGALENLSFGSLYPALGRLEGGGEIHALTADQTTAGIPVPFTGSLGGERAATVTRRATLAAAAAFGGRGTRARKIYEITPSGELLFDRLLESAAEKDDPRSFSLRLAFARHLSAPARTRLLERHQVELSRRLARANDALAAPARPIDRYQRSIAEHARDGIVADLAWVADLLAHELSMLNPTAPTGSRPRPQREIEPLTPVTAGTATRDGGTHD